MNQELIDILDKLPSTESMYIALRKGDAVICVYNPDVPSFMAGEIYTVDYMIEGQDEFETSNLVTNDMSVLDHRVIENFEKNQWDHYAILVPIKYLSEEDIFLIKLAAT